jgi:hypothetical protein
LLANPPKAGGGSRLGCAPRITRKVRRFDAPKEAFLEQLKGEDATVANKLVLARVMETLTDIARQREEARGLLHFLNFYRCLDPGSPFITAWTVLYVLLIFYIATFGLFSATFLDILPAGFGPKCGEITTVMLVDACVDGFFLLDIVFRLLLFGQVLNAGNNSTAPIVLVQPDQVLLRYVRNGLLVDVLTGVPIQWFILLLPTDCSSVASGESSRGLLLVRALRLIRITKVIKIFRTNEVRQWVKRLQRRLGNNNLMTSATMILVLLVVNHFWTCLGWLVYSIDIEGPHPPSWRSDISYQISLRDLTSLSNIS